MATPKLAARAARAQELPNVRRVSLRYSGVKLIADNGRCAVLVETDGGVDVFLPAGLGEQLVGRIAGAHLGLDDATLYRAVFIQGGAL